MKRFIMQTVSIKTAGMLYQYKTKYTLRQKILLETHNEFDNDKRVNASGRCNNYKHICNLQAQNI